MQRVHFFHRLFKEAIILTLDGVGEWATATVAHGKKNKIKMLKEMVLSFSTFIRKTRR